MAKQAEGKGWEGESGQEAGHETVGCIGGHQKYRPQDQTTWHVGAGLSRSEMGQTMGSVGQAMHA